MSDRDDVSGIVPAGGLARRPGDADEAVGVPIPAGGDPFADVDTAEGVVAVDVRATTG